MASQTSQRGVTRYRLKFRCLILLAPVKAQKCHEMKFERAKKTQHFLVIYCGISLEPSRLEEQAGKAPVCISAQLNRGGLERGRCARWPDLSYPISIFGSEKLLASEILLFNFGNFSVRKFQSISQKVTPPPLSYQSVFLNLFEKKKYFKRVKGVPFRYEM